MIQQPSNELMDFADTQARLVSLRRELEATRASFHALMDVYQGAAWHQKHPASAWTVGEVLVHLTWALEYLPEEVRRARQGRGMFNLPKRLSDFMSYWYIRWIARTATPEAIRRRYDQAMDASIRLLSDTPEADWKKGARFYGEGFYTVENLFHVPANHLTEHTDGLPLHE